MESDTAVVPQAMATDAASYLSGTSRWFLEPDHRFPDCPLIINDHSSKEAFTVDNIVLILV